MHGDNRNRKIRRFSPYGSSSSFDNEESAPSLDDNNISTIPGNYLPFYMPEFGIEAPNNLLGSEQDSLNFSMINDCLQLWGPNYYETNQYHNLIMTNEEIAETLLSETENNQPLQVHQQVEISSDITEFYS
ncbi:hypothetical protein RclHR1_00070004 [Rhizophagus clarus]|nr:hypothetical protein RclHR1_00070004 [Rhizophagus clarus]